MDTLIYYMYVIVDFRIPIKKNPIMEIKEK